MLKRAAMALLLGAVSIGVGASPASATCSNGGPQVFAAAWNGSWFQTTTGQRGSITKSSLSDLDGCANGIRYFGATVNTSLAPSTYQEYGFWTYKTGPGTATIRATLKSGEIVLSERTSRKVSLGRSSRLGEPPTNGEQRAA